MRRKRIPPTGRGKLNLEESQIIICMSKVRNFAELAPNIGLSEFDFYDLYRSTCKNSELGRMRKPFPLHAMERSFGTQKEHYDLRRVKAREFDTCKIQFLMQKVL